MIYKWGRIPKWHYMKKQKSKITVSPRLHLEVLGQIQMIKGFFFSFLDTSCDLTRTAHHVVMGITLLVSSIQWLSFQKSKQGSFFHFKALFWYYHDGEIFLPLLIWPQRSQCCLSKCMFLFKPIGMWPGKKTYGPAWGYKIWLENPQLLIKTLFFKINVPF